jgi:hypothetical protein
MAEDVWLVLKLIGRESSAVGYSPPSSSAHFQSSQDELEARIDGNVFKCIMPT